MSEMPPVTHVSGLLLTALPFPTTFTNNPAIGHVSSRYSHRSAMTNSPAVIRIVVSAHIPSLWIHIL
jgi:hypothetical protein